MAAQVLALAGDDEAHLQQKQRQCPLEQVDEQRFERGNPVGTGQITDGHAAQQQGDPLAEEGFMGQPAPAGLPAYPLSQHDAD